MSKVRPALCVGDVVRFSKRGLAKNRVKDTTMIVKEIHPYRGDLNDGRARVYCSVINTIRGKDKGSVRSFVRRDLWKTGYNINGQVDVHVPTITMFGMTKEQLAKKSGNNSKLCSCSIETLLNFGCKCGGR